MAYEQNDIKLKDTSRKLCARFDKYICFQLLLN